MIKKLFAKFMARFISKKLDLKEGPMNDSKKWWQSKGVWTGIITSVIGLYTSIDTQLGPQMGFDLPAIPEFVYILLGALGIYSRKVAKKEIK